MKKLFLLLFVTIYLYELCNAQYVGGANEQRKEEMKRDNERLNNVYNNNLPNDNGKNSVKILAPEYKKKEVYIPTESEKKREALRVSEAQEYNAKLKIQQQQRALNRYYTKLQYCNDLYNKNIANSILKSLDLKEFYRWAYADSYEGTKLLNSNSGYALGRLKLHQSDSGNTNFDTCINRLIDASIFSNTCVAELEKLKKRFPSKIVELEKLQLNAFIYYFGARFPNWESAGENDMAYAECQFQLSTVDEQNELLNEFLNLYYKHPEFTRAYIAGRARKNFNPFYLVTLAKQYSGGISQELRFNMLLQILQTKANEITPIYKKEKDNKKYISDIVYKRINAIAMEIRREYPFYLYSITAKQWVNLAEAQGVDLKTLGNAFMWSYVEKKPLQKFVNYQNALKGNLEPNTSNGIQKIEIDFHTYTGNVENGIPNAQGRWDKSNHYYEGIFKNGLPTKNGVYKEMGTKIIPNYGFDFESKDQKKYYIID